MKYMEFVIGMKNRYKNKNLENEEIISEINNCICKYLGESNKGELLVSIYKGILGGKTQTEIANECEVNKSLVADYLVKIRRLVDGLKGVGIDLKQFERFECRSYTFKEETLNKMDEKVGIKRNRS